MLIRNIKGPIESIATILTPDNNYLINIGTNSFKMAKITLSKTGTEHTFF